MINPTNFISSIGEGKRVADLIDAQMRGTKPKIRDMEITRVPTEYISTPNALLSEGVAEWSMSAMSRRLVWGDDYSAVGRQEMPVLPVPLRGMGTGDTTIEVELGFTKPIGFEEAKRCLQCQLNIFIDGHRCILCNGCVDACPHQCIEMISPDRIYSIDNDVELAAAGARRAGTVRRRDGDRRAIVHSLRHLRRLVPDRVPDHGSLPADPGGNPRKRRPGDRRGLNPSKTPETGWSPGKTTPFRHPDPGTWLGSRD